jgi:hypothetical protein
VAGAHNIILKVLIFIQTNDKFDKNSTWSFLKNPEFESALTSLNTWI